MKLTDTKVKRILEDMCLPITKEFVRIDDCRVTFTRGSRGDLANILLDKADQRIYVRDTSYIVNGICKTRIYDAKTAKYLCDYTIE